MLFHIVQKRKKPTKFSRSDQQSFILLQSEIVYPYTRFNGLLLGLIYNTVVYSVYYTLWGIRYMGRGMIESS